MFLFSPLLEGERALALMPKLPECYVGFLLLLFDCVHKKDFRKHSKTKNKARNEKLASFDLSDVEEIGVFTSILTIGVFNDMALV